MDTAREHKLPPAWLLGMGNGVFGLVGGFLVLPLPQMLAAQGVPEARIAGVSGACFSAAMWVFALGPLLDVRFSRRWWATAFGLLAGATMTAAVLLRTRLGWLEALLILSYAAATMSSNALGGWLAGLVGDDPTGRLESRVSAWTQVALFLGNGAMAIAAGELLRHTGTPIAALALGALVLLPLLAFLWVPSPADERRLTLREAGGAFREFARDVRLLLGRHDVLLALALFVLPTGSFALTNLLGGVAHDFRASDAFVSRMGGLLLSGAGAASCLLVPVLARRVRPVTLYLGIGLVGSIFTLAMVALPRSPGVLALGFMGENVFQAMSFTAAVAICLGVIGPRNPLAGTLFGLLTAATVLPIVLMERLDGHVYSAHGLRGMMAADGGLSLAACLAMSVVAGALLRRRPTKPPS